MSRNVYFYQPCPICGRSLQVRIEYLGRTVCCRHCRGEFRASPVNDRDQERSDSHSAVIPHTDAVLDAQQAKGWGLPQRTML
jgi:hypothetical protein